MTEHYGGGLIEGTLADLRTLMSLPPGLRRGNTQLVAVPAPAAGANLLYPIGASFWERIISVLATFTASAAAGTRTLSVNLLDGDGNVWNITPASPALQASMGWTLSADLAQSQPVFASASSSVFNQVTSPGAAAVIASLTLPAGTYTIAWTVGLGGTTGAGDTNNFQLNYPVGLLEESFNTGSSGSSAAQIPVTAEVPAGGATITVTAQVAGTVGAIYRAEITATPIGQLVSSPQIPDVILKPGFGLQIAAAGIQAGDQFGPARIYTERYPSNWADGALGQDIEGLLEAAGR